MLRLARDEERTATELAEAAGLSPSAASPHFKLLRETGLMHVRVDARRRLYRVDLAATGRGARRARRAVGWRARQPQAHGRGSAASEADAFSVKIVDRVVHIDADVGDVYALLTEAEGFVEWMAPTADARPDSPAG